MAHRSDLTGFIVLGPKPSGDPYRPDEEALLAETANRIGLDLHALRVEELKGANNTLSRQLDVLVAQLEKNLHAKGAIGS